MRSRLTLALAVAATAPAVPGWLHDDLATERFALHFLLAALAAWVGTGLLARLVDGYRVAALQNRTAEPRPGRRHDD